MTLAMSWIAFPVILAVLAIGCALLVEAVAGLRVPGALLAPLGLATIVVVAQLATVSDVTAELAMPLVVSLAIAGLALSFPWRGRRPDPWLLGTALAVFAVYAAPIVLSGEATFAGYIKLDDTATWMALTDRVMEHGRSLSGLGPSSYEATLDFNLAAGYPVGVFLPLGVGRLLSGQDVAWVIQPYLAFLAAMLALSMGAIVRAFVRSRALSAVVVFLGAQAALLYGYALWGGIKEVAAAAVIALAAALVPLGIGRGKSYRDLVPLGLATAALLGILSFGGGIWLAVLLLAALAAAVQITGTGRAIRTAAQFAAITLVLSAPLLAAGSLLPPTSSPLSSATAVGNLFEPLSKLQVLGIWPAGDFRMRPLDPEVTHILIAVVAAAAVAAAVLAWRAKAFWLLAYVATASIGCAALVAVGSPWVEAKALATASPAVLALGLAGAAALIGVGRRVEGAVPLLAVAIGVLWSTALAFQDVNLAPRDQLAELEEIGDRIAGEGPTLMTEYQPYGVRHFLREADPEGVSELRRRQVPTVEGGEIEKGFWADTDRLRLDGLLLYPTLVLRRSPAQSRPPSPYNLASKGGYYEVWQRGEIGSVVEHLPLGGATDPSGVPDCGDVDRLARLAGADGTLVAAPRQATLAIPMARTLHPSSWERPERPLSLFPGDAGSLVARVRLKRPGRYRLWLGGSVRGRMEARVDGRLVGADRSQLNNDGLYVELGGTRLGTGAHTIALRYGAADLHPGSGASGPNVYPIGPLVLTADDTNTPLIQVAPGQARALCGQRLDWVEALRTPEALR